jgi:folate-dependent phosphoribosylglycinamide formyltransferase PurN
LRGIGSDYNSASSHEQFYWFKILIIGRDVVNLAVFAYNFPHKKTQDFLFRLFADGIKPTVVLAANPIKLSIPESVLRVKPRHVDLIHPSIICRQMGIEYAIVEHNSEECRVLLNSLSIDIGLISGARILKKAIIDSVTKGIINLHPGLLPEVRGLDALQWAIHEGHPFGVTAHVIDERIDVGFIIQKKVVTEYADDTLVEVSLRLQETQTTMITEAIRLLERGPLGNLERVGRDTILHRKMPPELEIALPKRYAQRLAKYTTPKNGKE